MSGDATQLDPDNLMPWNAPTLWFTHDPLSPALLRLLRFLSTLTDM